MTDRKRILELATKWLTGTITYEEKKEFARWYNGHDDTRFESSATGEETIKERMYLKIIKDIRPEDNGIKSIRKTKWRWPLGIAASLSILFLISIFWHSFRRTDNVGPTNPKMPTLTLANGQTIILNPQQKGIIAGEDIKYANGDPILLSSKSTAQNILHASGTQNLRLTTPKGLIYEVTLPDGSRVMLNAGSTLSYPSRFSANERIVELQGEAFFEISKLNMPAKFANKGKAVASTRVPFKVKTAGQVVEVLGTKFNLNAYLDDRATQTTLVEGAVKVSTDGAGMRFAQLSPGEQAQSDANGLSVRAVDTEHYTSWRNGYFYFDNASIPAVLAQMQRWYDFHTDYETNDLDQVFSGKIPRNISLAEAVNILSKAGIAIRLTGDHQVVLGSTKKTISIKPKLNHYEKNQRRVTQKHKTNGGVKATPVYHLANTGVFIGRDI